MSNDENRSVSEAEVSAYLREHPDFFQNQLELLAEMQIPHPSGNAVSLIAKQLEIFRAKHQEQENQLTLLIDIARENDAAFNRMHELTLAMLEAVTINEVLINLGEVLAECFLTDFVAVKIITEQDVDVDNRIMVHSADPVLKHFANELRNNQAKCGRPTLAQAQLLFAEQAFEVKSCAIIPMVFTELEGIIGIGSRDEQRFHHSMGSLFLTQMSEIIGTRLISLLRPQA
ncbi:DUF484 family protein [Methylomonas paludis]|uniref:DUF484 family protein n=1 Tax=Methylomonas paludis TaxID=1173101 RepID=A0A975MNN5_9GAMM|nr:DUF484 family protein [Methylomonas paludis]QWF70979.1 DUF484 family protein [Methylomonas paludis]